MGLNSREWNVTFPLQERMFAEDQVCSLGVLLETMLVLAIHVAVMARNAYYQVG